MKSSTRCPLGFLMVILLLAICAISAFAQTNNQDPLVQVLVQKGVLTKEDAGSITGSPAEQRERLVQLLKAKGVLSENDIKTMGTPTPVLQPAAITSPASPGVPVQAVSSPQGPPPKPGAPPAPTFIPAVAPVRVLQLEPSKAGGLIPDIKLGTGARLKLYGFLKLSAIYDSSSPYGNDFPLPGFIGDGGPDNAPEFHTKARASRIGANFEWPDPSGKVAVTGKFEMDFEGNFTRVNNRNISAIRSSMASIRLAWGRVDYHTSDNTSVYVLGGQDWTPFGSSILSSTLETTGLQIGFGTLYERAPQLRVGLVHSARGDRKFTFAPEFAIALPGFGDVPPFVTVRCPTASTITVPTTTPGGTTTVCTSNANLLAAAGTLGDQLGYGERQGPDSTRPEIQGRLVFQWQADKAKGVAPAQIIVAGMHANRTVIVPIGNIRTFAPTGAVTAIATAFPRGATTDADRWGYQAGFSIPTRFATLQATYYRGTDLRWYFAGQIYTEFNNTAGLTGVPGGGTGGAAGFVSIPSIDGSTSVLFGVAPGGVVTAVPQLPVRAQGGFAELGLPLSRIFNAEPTSRAAGWSMNFHYGYDGVFARDVRKVSPGGGRAIGDVGFVNLLYKFNQFLTFGYELSYYRTRAVAGPTGELPIAKGVPSHQWHDVRSEFSTIFTF